jgi:hypothetical protein
MGHWDHVTLGPSDFQTGGLLVHVTLGQWDMGSCQIGSLELYDFETMELWAKGLWAKGFWDHGALEKVHWDQ